MNSEHRSSGGRGMVREVALVFKTGAGRSWVFGVNEQRIEQCERAETL